MTGFFAIGEIGIGEARSIEPPPLVIPPIVLPMLPMRSNHEMQAIQHAILIPMLVRRVQRARRR